MNIHGYGSSQYWLSSEPVVGKPHVEIHIEEVLDMDGELIDLKFTKAQ